MSLIDVFLSAFIALFVIADPIGTASIFAVLTRTKSQALSFKIALKATTIAVCILILFGFVGAWLLGMLGITLPAFRIAGGLLLFVTAFRMIVSFHDPDQVESEKSKYGKDDDIAVFPLAIPLLSGPGCMTAVLLHMTAEPGEWQAKAAVVTAILCVQLIAFLVMVFSQRMIKAVGETGGSLLARIMGILLAALSVQFVADGIRQLFFA